MSRRLVYLSKTVYRSRPVCKPRMVVTFLSVPKPPKVHDEEKELSGKRGSAPTVTDTSRVPSGETPREDRRVEENHPISGESQGYRREVRLKGQSGIVWYDTESHRPLRLRQRVGPTPGGLPCHRRPNRHMSVQGRGRVRGSLTCPSAYLPGLTLP